MISFIPGRANRHFVLKKSGTAKAVPDMGASSKTVASTFERSDGSFPNSITKQNVRSPDLGLCRGH
jgi:hypothetical protein